MTTSEEHAVDAIQEQIYEIRDYLVQLKDFFRSEEFKKLPQGLQDWLSESAESWENEQWNRLRVVILKHPDIGSFDI